MTTKKTYYCNLCHSSRDPEELEGLYFVGTDIENRPARDVENHICRTCWVSIFSLMRDDSQNGPSSAWGETYADVVVNKLEGLQGKDAENDHILADEYLLQALAQTTEYTRIVNAYLQAKERVGFLYS